MKFFIPAKPPSNWKICPIRSKKRIVDKMRFYASRENPLKFAKHLTNHQEGNRRFRVGDYRLIFDVKNNAIYILKVAKRGEIYD